MGVPSVLVIFLICYGGGAIVGGLPGLVGCARADVTPFQAGLAALTIVQGAFDARNSPRLQAFLSQILH